MLGLEFVTLSKTKANRRHLRGGKNFPAFARAELALGHFGQPESARNRLTKRSQAESLQRQPNFESAKTSRQLNAVFTRIDFLGLAINIAQIIGNRRAQILDRQSKVIIAFEFAYSFRSETNDAQRPFHRRMRLVRKINSSAVDSVLKKRVTRRH